MSMAQNIIWGEFGGNNESSEAWGQPHNCSLTWATLAYFVSHQRVSVSCAVGSDGEKTGEPGGQRRG